jgi:predicted TIM-barrel fold metal-dependent hydrolase
MQNKVVRRDLLRSMALAGAGLALSGGKLRGQAAMKSTAKGGRIDVHHHHTPPALQAAGGRGRNGLWTPERSLEQMDKFDIAVAILSLTQMGDLLYDGTEKGRANVRLGNDYGARLMSDHPKRFGLFSAIPLPDLDGSLREIEYGLDKLKADGIGIYTNDNNNRWPGDPYFDPIWQELNRRKTIVYMHPLAPRCCRELNDGVPTAMNEFDFDITRAATSLLAGGVLHKYPELRFIIPHSGGTLPVLAGRIKDRYPMDPKHTEYIPNGVSPELQKFYFDIAHASFPMPLAALLKFAPTTHILFGTDFSPEPIESTVDQLPTSGLSPALMRAIERDNAEKLFPRFKV